MNHIICSRLCSSVFSLSIWSAVSCPPSTWTARLANGFSSSSNCTTDASAVRQVKRLHNWTPVRPWRLFFSKKRHFWVVFFFASCYLTRCKTVAPSVLIIQSVLEEVRSGRFASAQTEQPTHSAAELFALPKTNVFICQPSPLSRVICFDAAPHRRPQI